MLPESGVRLVAETSQYDRAMRQVIADADRVDAALSDVVDAANKAERSLNDLDGDVSIKTNVDDQELRNARDVHDDVNTNTDTTTNVSDSELKTARDIHDDVNTNTDTTANVDTSQLETALNIVQNLANPITLTIGVAGAGLGALTGLAGGLGVNAIIEMDSALQGLEGTTGRIIPGAEHLIVDLYTNAWGESRTAIAGVVGEAAKLGIANDQLEEAVRTAFNVSDTGIGETDEVLRAMDTLVKNELVPDFTTAGDLIVTGFQTGADRGGDLLDTFNEYSSTFKELRISGPAALGLINSGLAAGVDNSDRIADAIRETGIRLGEIGTNPDIKNAFIQLDNLSTVDLAGQLEAYNAGQISGDEFFAGFFDSLAQAQAADPAAAQTIAATLVGTIAEDFGTETIAQLTPEWDTAMGTLEGRAATASNTINDNLSTSITGFLRTVEQEFANILENSLPIQDIIDKAKAAVQVFSAELQSGASLSEALTISLGIDESAFGQFESIIGNIVLALADLTAVIAGLFGQTDAMNAIRRGVFGQAQTQFVFDAKLADNGQALEDDIAMAAFRGLNAEDIQAGLGQAIDELIAEGDLERAREFAQLLNEIQGTGGNIVNGVAIDEAIPYVERTEALNEYEATVQRVIDSINSADFDTFFAEIGKIDDPALLRAGFDRAAGLVFPGVAQDIVDQIGASDPDTAAALQPLVDDMKAALTDRMIEAVENGDFEFARQIAEQGLGDEALLTAIDELQAGSSEKWDAIVADVQTASSDIDTELGTAAENVSTHSTSIVGDLDLIDQKLIAITAEGRAAAAALSQLTGDGGGDGSVETHAGGGDLLRQGTNIVGPGEIVSLGNPGPGSVINAARSQELMTALGAIARIPANGGGSTVNNFINVSQANHVRNMAQANAAGFQLSAQVRGFA